MSSKGRETTNLNPEQRNRFLMSGNDERPMSDGDATGHVPQERYGRHVAVLAWQHIREKQHADEPLPDWVLEYLRGVSQRVDDEMGPQGGVSQKGAWTALGIDGKAWLNHPPIKIFRVMSEWIHDPALVNIDGPKAAARRYIEDYMNKDRHAKVDTLIRKYKEGKRLWSEDQS